MSDNVISTAAEELKKWLEVLEKLLSKMEADKLAADKSALDASRHDAMLKELKGIKEGLEKLPASDEQQAALDKVKTQEQSLTKSDVKQPTNTQGASPQGVPGASPAPPLPTTPAPAIPAGTAPPPPSAPAPSAPAPSAPAPSAPAPSAPAPPSQGPSAPTPSVSAPPPPPPLPEPGQGNTRSLASNKPATTQQSIEADKNPSVDTPKAGEQSAAVKAGGPKTGKPSVLDDLNKEGFSSPTIDKANAKRNPEIDKPGVKADDAKIDAAKVDAAKPGGPKVNVPKAPPMKFG